MKTAVTIEGKPIEIPSGWHDVSMEMFLRLMEPIDSFQLCSILTGLDQGDAKNIPEAIIETILSPCRVWIDEGFPENSPHSLPLPDDIQQMEFARRINCEFMLKDSTIYSCCIKILAIYLAASSEDEDIERKHADLLRFPCVEVIAGGKELLKQYEKLCEDEAKMPKPNKRNEELRAGIKELDKFGIFAFVDGMAGGDILKHDAIYKQPYAKVMLKARMNIEVSNYQQRLSDVLNKK